MPIVPSLNQHDADVQVAELLCILASNNRAPLFLVFIDGGHPQTAAMHARWINHFDPHTNPRDCNQHMVCLVCGNRPKTNSAHSLFKGSVVVLD